MVISKSINILGLLFWAPTGALDVLIWDLRLSVCVCTLCNRALRMALKELLQHFKESRGVLGKAQERAEERAQERADERA